MRIHDYQSSSTDGLIREAARLAMIIPAMRLEGKPARNVDAVSKKLSHALRELRAREAVVSVPASVDSIQQLVQKYGR